MEKMKSHTSKQTIKKTNHYGWWKLLRKWFTVDADFNERSFWKNTIGDAFQMSCSLEISLFPIIIKVHLFKYQAIKEL